MSEHPGPGEAAATVVARAAWSGFLVLVVGEIVVLAVTKVVPGIAAPGISFVAAAAFAIAGARAGDRLVGAVAACGAYGLTIPLAVMVGSFQWQFALLSVSLALVVGAMAGGLSARWTRTGHAGLRRLHWPTRRS